MTAVTTVPVVRAEAERRTRLGTMKRRATALLAFATVVFLVVTLWGGDGTGAGYLQAAAEAAMVGGLADWFAVTALFRHPLGLPIPHTAIIVARKNQFGETLGRFIQDTFLSPDALVARLDAAMVTPRVSAWLRDPAHADRLAADLLDGAVRIADLVNDDDVQRVLHGAVRTRVETVPAAPLAGRTLEFLIRDGRHLFIEFKRPGGSTRAVQTQFHKRLRLRGFRVEIVDSVEEGRGLIDEYKVDPA